MLVIVKGGMTEGAPALACTPLLSLKVVDPDALGADAYGTPAGGATTLS